MKAFTIIMKILAAAAAIVGAVYVAATYGDKIVAWAKKLLGCCSCCDECNCPCEDDCDNCPCDGDCDTCECDCCEEEVEVLNVEEFVPAEEAPAEEAAAEEVPAEDQDFVEE